MIKFQKKFDQMRASELRDATSMFDREMTPGWDGLPGRPLSAAQRRTWNRAKRRMGRPKIGKGVKRVMISVEMELLTKTDRFAERNHLSRSEMISAGLRLLMAS